MYVNVKAKYVFNQNSCLHFVCGALSVSFVNVLYKVNFRFMSKFSHLKPDLASSQYPRNDGCYFDQIAKLPKRFSEASGAMIWAHPNALPLNTWGMFEIIICFTV